MKKYLIAIFLLVFCGKLFAQDPSFSQFYFNQLYYNPAFCGFTGGTYVSATYRSLWPTLPGHYNSQKFSWEYNIPNDFGLGGIGVIVANDDEGPSNLSSGNLKTISIGVPFSIRPVSFSKKNDFNFQFGVEPSIIQKSINWDKLIFSDQYSPVDGDFITSSSFSGKDDNSGRIVPDLAVGGVFDYRQKLNRLYYHITGGIACYHILEPSHFFYNFESVLPRKLVIHTSIQRDLKSDNSISFTGVYEGQKKMKTYLFGSNFLFNHTVYVGTWFRTWTAPLGNADAVIFIAGAGIPAYSKRYHPFVSLSYDLTVSKLAGAANNALEINISVLIDQKTNNKCKHKRYVDPFITIEHAVKSQFQYK